MKLSNLVKNKHFCYLTYALMVINLLGYVSVGSMECVVVFALATFACKSFLTKNMCLCIFGGLFASNILFGCSKVKEGLTGGEGSTSLKCGEGTEEKNGVCVVASQALSEAEETQAAAEAASEKEEIDQEVAMADEAAAGEAAAEGDSDDTKKVEEFRNIRANRRRNRRRAVREAFSTIRRAIRSY